MTTSAAVSVVIPCYRCTKTIARAVASVAAQTSVPAEVILVDDGSGDEARVLMQALQGRYPRGWIQLVSLDQNMGAGSARNAGWAVAAQPYVAFLDADDAWHPQKIEIQVAYMEANPDVALSGHGYRLLERDVLPDWRVEKGDALLVSKWAMILSNRFVTPSAMLRRDLVQRYAEGQRHMEDHMLWMSIICSGGRVVKLPAELAAIYKASYGVTGLSAQFWAMEQGELGNFRRLYREQWINGFQLAFLDFYSMLKFGRRLLIYWGYLRWTK